MPPKLFISDQRMLQLMDWAIKNKIANGETHYMELIDFQRNSIVKVRKGLQGFRKNHILNACKLTGASADWIFGLTNVMMRKNPGKPLELLKQAVIAVEQEMKTK
jgi:hypothetical protein